MVDEASTIKVCPRCGGAWAGNLRRCLFCHEELTTPAVTPLVHIPDMGWCVVCSATGLPLLDTKGSARRYTKDAAVKAAERMDQQADVNRMPDVRYFVRRLTDDERREKAR